MNPAGFDVAGVRAALAAALATFTADSRRLHAAGTDG
jgi:hypothetical protein